VPLSALLAPTRGNKAGYRDYRDRYRAMATSLGFEGHAGLVGPEHYREAVTADRAEGLLQYHVPAIDDPPACAEHFA